MKKNLSSYLFSAIPLAGIIGLLSFKAPVEKENFSSNLKDHDFFLNSLPCGFPSRGIVTNVVPSFHSDNTYAILKFPENFVESHHVPATIASVGGAAELRMQGDGNLVLYQATSSGWKSFWSSHTANSGATTMWFQSDGNLVLKNASGAVVWNSGIHSSCNIPANCYFTMQNDGNLVMRYDRGDGTAYAIADSNSANQHNSSWVGQLK